MPSYKIISIEPAIEKPFLSSATLRNQLNYFVITKSAEDEQRLAPNEFEVDLNDVARWAESGTIRMVSPAGQQPFCRSGTELRTA